METGVSIGTLYEYFPNKEALLSGYVRHCMDRLLEMLEEQVIAPADLSWEERLHRLVRLTCGLHPELPPIDPGMLQLEGGIAEPKHHRRVYEEVSGKWIRAIAACVDLPREPGKETIEALFVATWGARRYLLLLKSDEASVARYADELERACRARLREG